MKEACLRWKEKEAMYLWRQAECRDEPLQSVIGLSGPAPKAGLVQ